MYDGLKFMSYFQCRYSKVVVGFREIVSKRSSYEIFSRRKDPSLQTMESK